MIICLENKVKLEIDYVFLDGEGFKKFFRKEVCLVLFSLVFVNIGNEILFFI